MEEVTRTVAEVFKSQGKKSNRRWGKREEEERKDRVKSLRHRVFEISLRCTVGPLTLTATKGQGLPKGLEK